MLATKCQPGRPAKHLTVLTGNAARRLGDK